MYRSLATLALASAVPSAAHGQMAKAPDATACAGLAEDFDSAEKALARISIDGIGDNSAPRATLREQRTANELSTAAITVDLMRAHNCPLPKRAPNSAWYLGAALACQTQLLAGRANAPECKLENWKRDGPAK